MKARVTGRSTRIALPLAISMSLLTAACGSTAAAPKTSGPALTGDPIKIAIISDATVTGAGSKPEIAAAAQARVDEINANGGIHGSPLVLTACDTKGDPNVGQACARTAVADGAVAVVGLTSTTDSLITPILEQAHVAAVGTTPLTGAAGDSSIAFCFNPGIAGDFLAVGPALTAAGAKKVALLYPGDVGAVSANAKGAFDMGAKIGNVTTGEAVGFSSTSAQFDAPIAKVTENGVDGVAAVAPGSSQATVIAALRQQRPDVKVGTISVGLTPDIISALGTAAEGTVAVALTQPATATSVPGIEKFNADMDAHAGSVPRTDLAINSWAAVWAFQQITATLPKVTRESFLDAMSKAKDLDLGGIYPPLSASAKSSAVPGLSCALNKQVVFTKVSNGNLVALEPGKFYNPFGG